MRTKHFLALGFFLVAPHTVGADDLDVEWSIQSGNWQRTREILPVIHQRATTGFAEVRQATAAPAVGVWRTTVKLSQGTEQAGLLLCGDETGKTGLRLLLGGRGETRGLELRSAGPSRETLWSDPYAPWSVYHAYVIEAVVERGRARVQMFTGNGKVLISQSPWLDVGQQMTEAGSQFGLFTENGAARFYASGHGAVPLSPLVDDPPNKRRLIQEDDSPWTVVGEGNWMWLTSRRQQLRQSAPIERTWAINRGIRGTYRTWECRVKVDPGTKGAGMLFQTNADAEGGFICWLGGEYGAGALMLYQREPTAKALWSSQQDRWHYDTEYVLRAESRLGQLRVQQLAADGQTVISDSSWIHVDAQTTNKEGYLAFHTWSGSAEFWAFDDKTQGTGEMAAAAAADNVRQLGDGWETRGDGTWQWADAQQTRLQQKPVAVRALAINMRVTGSLGQWRCLAKITSPSDAVGLLFQSDTKATEGFAGLLTGTGVQLETLNGKTLWKSDQWKPAVDTEYVIEGAVSTDRVSLRILKADGQAVLMQCPDIYVPESNNTRQGHVGLIVRKGQAEFCDWQLIAP